MNIKTCTITDVGKERTCNEDAVIICPDLTESKWETYNTSENYLPVGHLGTLIAVADGMGGANAGEIASSLAINCLKENFTKDSISNLQDSEENIYGFLRETISQANEAIMNYAVSTPNSTGLGTTILLLWIKKEQAYIAWCGDSRCYCFNPQKGLKPLTKDHSLVQELVDQGKIQPEEAFNHPDNSIITRCLGDVSAITEPELYTYPIHEGDIFLLCSDGLCGYCKDTLIEKTIYNYYDNLNVCKDELLKIALDSGGYDNITIALCATLPDNMFTPPITINTRFKRMIQRCAHFFTNKR